MANRSDLIANLTSAGRIQEGVKLRIDVLFGDRPDVLDAIRTARANGASHATIAKILSDDGQRVGFGAVRNWMLSQGIE